MLLHPIRTCFCCPPAKHRCLAPWRPHHGSSGPTRPFPYRRNLLNQNSFPHRPYYLSAKNNYCRRRSSIFHRTLHYSTRSASQCLAFAAWSFALVLHCSLACALLSTSNFARRSSSALYVDPTFAIPLCAPSRAALRRFSLAIPAEVLSTKLSSLLYDLGCHVPLRPLGAWLPFAQPGKPIPEN